jgi:hypothetical protein
MDIGDDEDVDWEAAAMEADLSIEVRVVRCDVV